MGRKIAEQNRQRKKFVKDNSSNTIFKIGGSYNEDSSGKKKGERPETHLGYTRDEIYKLFLEFHDEICLKQFPGDDCYHKLCPAGLNGICDDRKITDDWKEMGNLLVGARHIEPTEEYMKDRAEKNREIYLQELRDRYGGNSTSMHP